MFRAANTKTEQQTRTPPPEKREVEPPSTECTRFEKFAKQPHAIGHGRGPIPRRRGTSVAGSRDQLEHFCYRHTSRQAQTRHRVSSISGKITGISICGTSARATEVVFSLRPPTADRLSRNPWGALPGTGHARSQTLRHTLTAELTTDVMHRVSSFG